MGADLCQTFLALVRLICGAFRDPRARRRAQAFAVGFICAALPKTITSALTRMGRCHTNWSGEYKLMSQARWETAAVFAPIVHQTIDSLPSANDPIISAQDDTILRKTGRKIPGTSYARDPLSPPFHVNLVLSQRFLQTALFTKGSGPDRMFRAIPVGFLHAPPLKASRGASAQERQAIKEARKIFNISSMAREELLRLRQEIDRHPGGPQRLLFHSVDGSFANRTFLNSIPACTLVIARIRKDARLRAFLDPAQRRGAKKYGPPLPTPDQLLHDESIAWRQLPVFVARKRHVLRYKQIDNVCWPGATRDKPVCLILIKPPRYRLRKGAKLLYRQPAFLLCTAATVDPQQAIRAYLARWEIEVCFRDEKAILGVGQSHVRNPISVQRTPAFLVALYSCLTLANVKALDDRRTEQFPPLPRWRKDIPLRPSLRDLLEFLQRHIEHVATIPPVQQAACF